jgi:hypothetical protein
VILVYQDHRGVPRHPGQVERGKLHMTVQINNWVANRKYTLPSELTSRVRPTT